MSYNMMTTQLTVLDALEEQYVSAFGTDTSRSSFARHIGEHLENLIRLQQGQRVASLEKMARWVMKHNETLPDYPVSLVVERDTVSVYRGLDLVRPVVLGRTSVAPLA